MKKFLFTGFLLTLLIWSGCKVTHPSKVVVDPEFKPNEIVSILIAPFISSISEAEDPKRFSETIMDRVLREQLAAREDYKFISTQTFKFALKKAGLEDRYEEFKENWIKNHTIDKDFLTKMRLLTNAQTMLVPYVYLWYKDQADYREASTASSTQVGATLSLVDMTTGKILWEATDENVKESVRSEGRTVVSSGGYVRRIEGVSATGQDIYSAPPFSDVAVMVLQAIVDAFPRKQGIE